MSDTDTFHAVYENLDCKLMYNPTREQVAKVLYDNPGETLLAFGHGTPNGLLNAEMDGYVIDCMMDSLLREREVIGIWCYASMFAMKSDLHGFFTNMFISNSMEAWCMGCGDWDNEVLFEQNEKFAVAINDLIKREVPMNQWVQTLYDGCDKHMNFVEFNYSKLTYFPKQFVGEVSDPEGV